jgi:hypothetical protein
LVKETVSQSVEQVKLLKSGFHLIVGGHCPRRAGLDNVSYCPGVPALNHATRITLNADFFYDCALTGQTLNLFGTNPSLFG